MMDPDLPQPDQLPGAPHPRDADAVIGQANAQSLFLDAFNGDRLHHAWMITGPRGIGKATLAWRLAKFLLATPMVQADDMFGAPPPPTTLDIDPENPVVRRMKTGAESRLFVLRRPYDPVGKKLKKEITVEEARKLKGFFSMSAADGGRRVVIIDSADEMNVNAANGILKVLEEPPANTVLFLIAHQPSRILPTIRSRCRMLKCDPLQPDEMAEALGHDASDALSELSQGSVGDAMQLSNSEGLETYQTLINLFARLPDFDRLAALKFAESAAARGAEERFDLILRLSEHFLTRLARTGSGRPPIVAAAEGEIDLLMRLAPSLDAGRAWADLQQSLSERIRRGRAVNLDPAALILDMVLKIKEVAAQSAQR